MELRFGFGSRVQGYGFTWVRAHPKGQVVLIYGVWYLKKPFSPLIGSTWTLWVRFRD